MKTYLITLVATLYFVGAPTTWAHVPSARHAEGVIENVDRNNMTIAIRSNSEVSIFYWNERTRFILNNKQVISVFPKVGEKIDCWYLKPLFGDPLVKRISWQDSPGIVDEAIYSTN